MIIIGLNEETDFYILSLSREKRTVQTKAVKFYLRQKTTFRWVTLLQSAWQSNRDLFPQPIKGWKIGLAHYRSAKLAKCFHRLYSFLFDLVRLFSPFPRNQVYFFYPTSPFSSLHIQMKCLSLIYSSPVRPFKAESVAEDLPSLGLITQRQGPVKQCAALA